MLEMERRSIPPAVPREAAMQREEVETPLDELDPVPPEELDNPTFDA
jgi:hypothetical protein